MLAKPPLNTPSYASETMRPLKYKNLGEMGMYRLPHKVVRTVYQLCDIMQQLEENGRDSDEVILQVLGELEERLGD
jgi:hypothetical protein